MAPVYVPGLVGAGAAAGGAGGAGGFTFAPGVLAAAAAVAEHQLGAVGANASALYAQPGYPPSGAAEYYAQQQEAKRLRQ
jgi:hypothetical protein